MRCENLVDEQNIYYIGGNGLLPALPNRLSQLLINGTLLMHQLQEEYHCNILKIYAQLVNNNDYILGIEFIHPKAITATSRNKMAKKGKLIATQLIEATHPNIILQEIHISFIIEDFTFIIGSNRHMGKADWEEYFTFQHSELVD